MTLREDLLTIYTDPTLTRSYKRSVMRRLKMSAFLNRLNGRVGQVMTRGRFTVMLIQEAEYRTGGRLALWVEVKRDGIVVPLDLPIYIINPPVRVPDGLGGFDEDLLGVIQSVIIGLVK